MTALLKHLKAHEVLFREGDVGECAYVVEQGRISIVRDNQGDAQELSQLGPGECLGEMALISLQPRMASAIACEDSVLTVVTPEHLSERLARSDPLIRHLLQLTLRRYQQVMGGDAVPAAILTADLSDEALALQRMRTENQLINALENEELELYFQPIINLEDRITAGFEALLRWQKPGEGLVAPDLFIPIAEESHIIELIGQWIIEEACRCRQELAKSWPDPLKPDFSVSVNLAARQIPDTELLPCIRSAMLRHDVQPHTLRLEVTESQIMENFGHAMSVLRAIKDLGCRVAIDDFGTGHSSLAYLNRLPVDTLKIDKAFLDNMLNDASSQKIIGGVAQLAKSLGMTLITEGAETKEEVDMLQQLGVEQVQGYYFGKPTSLRDL